VIVVSGEGALAEFGFKLVRVGAGTVVTVNGSAFEGPVLEGFSAVICAVPGLRRRLAGIIA
jgi:hypothetical protein